MNEFVARNGVIAKSDTTISGSLIVTGSAITLNGIGVLLNNQTASLSVNSASFASTASSADNFTVRGTLTAQTIIAQTITSSIDFVTGSTRNGSDLTNTHEFTGSVSIAGSLAIPSVSVGTTETNILVADTSGNIRFRSNLSLQGTTGTQGTNGSNGAQGTQGTTGTNGTIGVDGAQGATGAQGAAGSQGATGAQGIQGRQGTTGAQGTTGTNGGAGAQGTTGATGPSGRISPNGVDYGSYGSIGVSGTTNSYAGISFSGVSGTLMMNSGASGFYYNNSTWRVYWDGSGNQNNTGNVTAYASDRRLKKNIKNIPNALGKILKINGVNYDWDLIECNRWDFHPNESDIGVIAQEIQEVCPEAVTYAPFDRDPLNKNNSKSGQDYLTVHYEKIVPLLIEGIKEQQTQIEELKNRISILENK
jgi:hypothetical protein